MAAIVRRALGRELAGGEASEAAKRRAPASFPRDVRVWLRSPPGTYSHLARDRSHEPADWDADAEDAGLDAD
ncbi:MAG: hypothetical protein HYY06_30425 [Deltaproteobacteria bacterium]|nr:hypothetical protein [Deltaproteobacteria bacterium]